MKRARVMFRGDRHMATADGSGLRLDDGRSVECHFYGQPLALVDGRVERCAVDDERALCRHGVIDPAEDLLNGRKA